jgi:hypothetical protein
MEINNMNLNNVNANLAVNQFLANNANNNYGNFMRQMYGENEIANNLANNANNNYGNFMRQIYGENEIANNLPKLNCDREGFDLKMRLASGGLEYEKRVGHIHMDGEQWSYNTLVDFAIDGRIIDWYIKELREQGIRFTDQEIGRIKSNETLQILSAFFHRYKIVAERLALAKDLFNRSIPVLPPSVRNNQKKLLQEFAVKKINGMGVQEWDFPIEIAIDRAQCLMFYIVKHKGKPPHGFVMDERIRVRALHPIFLVWHLLDDGYLGGDRNLPPEELMPKRMNALLDWLWLLENEYRQLSDPPVTFGVFE